MAAISESVRGTGSGRPFDALVLAGGLSRRMNSVDKCAIPIDNRPLLDRATAAVDQARIVIVVGPERATESHVWWAREDPPGSGPVAAIRAGLAALADAGGMAESGGLAPAGSPADVVIVAGDLPFAGPAIRALRREWPADTATAGVIAVDAEGRDQYLLGIWDKRALANALAANEPRSMRELVTALDVTRVRVPDNSTWDCDTPEDLARAVEALEGQPGGV